MNEPANARCPACDSVAPLPKVTQGRSVRYLVVQIEEGWGQLGRSYGFLT